MDRYVISVRKEIWRGKIRMTQARFMINVSRYEERAKRVRERPSHPLDLYSHHSVAI
jgi:hypothetical protein